jgi:iron complex outermembrane receptor protein
MRKLKHFGLALAAELALVAMLAVTSRAQQAPSPGGTDQGGGQLQQITVTGYLTPRIGEGPQPVTTYDRDYMSKQSSQNVADILQNLPAATGNFSPNTTTGFGFSPGSSSIALKGLPPNDTLVLVDGLRFPHYAFPQQSTAGAIDFVDLNSIPVAAVDRVEILNDGGSATYGTDAAAGVVNIILKAEYTGVDITNYFGISQRGDNNIYHLAVVGGAADNLGKLGKINIVAALDYYSSSPIMAQDRPFTRQDSNVYSPNYPGHPIFPGYRSTFADPSGNFLQVNPGSNVPITPANFTVNGNDIEYNDAFYQLLPRESRIGGYVRANWDVTDYLRFYDSFIASRNEELSSYENQAVYPPAAFNSGGALVPANNPFNPFGVPLTWIQGALGEFGPLRADSTITTVRNVVGATLQLPGGWYLDGSFLYGESDGTYNQYNMFTTSGMNQALAGTLPGHVGQFFNPFLDQNFIAGNQAFYNAKGLVTTIYQDNRTDLVNWNIHGGGILINLPAGSLAVAGGLEYRSESYIQNEDDNSKFGNVLGFQNTVGVLTNGRRYLRSIFGELDIPLFGDKWSWPGMRLLDTVLSIRRDDYSDFGAATKPKIAVRYKPFNDLTIRATYAEGFTAPSLPQLFGAPLPAETGLVNPAAPQLGSQTTIVSTFGNPQLKPQESYGYFVGAVWTPASQDPDTSWWRWAKGLSLYVNWYQIDIHNLIGTLTPQQVSDLGSAAPPGNFLVIQPNGVISSVRNTYLNLGNQRSDGLEFGGSYITKEYPWGKIDFETNANYFYYVSAKRITGLTSTGGLQFTVENLTDTFGAPAGPDFRLLTSLFYSKTLFGIDTFRTGLTLHFTDSEDDVTSNNNGTNPNFHSDVAGTNYVHLIGNWTTLDWQISYAFGAPTEVNPNSRPGYDQSGKKVLGEQAISPKTEGSSNGLRHWLANTTLTFGITNLGDARPPFSSDWYQGYDYNYASFVMRAFYVQIEKKF